MSVGRDEAAVGARGGYWFAADRHIGEPSVVVFVPSRSADPGGVGDTVEEKNGLPVVRFPLVFAFCMRLAPACPTDAPDGGDGALDGEEVAVEKNEGGEEEAVAAAVGRVLRIEAFSLFCAAMCSSAEDKFAKMLCSFNVWL